MTKQRCFCGAATFALLMNEDSKNRITFVCALFLCLIAVMPIIMQSITGITTLTLGGTAMLIVVQVGLKRLISSSVW